MIYKNTLGKTFSIVLFAATLVFGGTSAKAITWTPPGGKIKSVKIATPTFADILKNGTLSPDGGLVLSMPVLGACDYIRARPSIWTSPNGETLGVKTNFGSSRQDILLGTVTVNLPASFFKDPSRDDLKGTYTQTLKGAIHESREFDFTTEGIEELLASIEENLNTYMEENSLVVYASGSPFDPNGYLIGNMYGETLPVAIPVSSGLSGLGGNIQNVSVVPEPQSILLLGAGLLMLVLGIKFKKLKSVSSI